MRYLVAIAFVFAVSPLGAVYGAGPDQTNPDQVKVVKPDQAKPDQVKVAKPDQAKPDQVKVAKPDQAKPDQVKVVKLDQAKPDQVKPDQVKGHVVAHRYHTHVTGILAHWKYHLSPAYTKA